MNFGLERIHNLLDALDRPDDRTKIIHVAGTNGKGSVCAYIASVLHTCGYSVGRFNSPHLIEPNDSINVNGQSVSKTQYDEAFTFVSRLNRSKAIGASTFECLVGAAFYVFDQFNLDFVVLEVGLGGLLDATNAIQHPVMTIITSIGLDHGHILGHTLEEIATAKAGIMKPGCPVVIAPQDTVTVSETLVSHAKKTGSPYQLVTPAQFVSAQICPLESVCQLENPSYLYPIRLIGDYQRMNSATAVTALDWMQRLGLIKMLPDQLSQGMQQTRWPGRLDWVDKTENGKIFEQFGLDRILVDGAHNPPATIALRNYISSLGLKHVVWIIGTTEGKDIEEMMRELVKPEDVVFAVTFSQPEGMPWIHSTAAEDLAKEATHRGASRVECCTNLPEALKKAGTISTPRVATVLCGSLYLVADLYRLLL